MSFKEEVKPTKPGEGSDEKNIPGYPPEHEQGSKKPPKGEERR